MYLSYDQFRVPRGVLSVIGSGGKTTFLSHLAETLPGTVLLTTTVHIFPFTGIPLIEAALGETADSLRERMQSALRDSRILCLGTPLLSEPLQEGKLCAPPVDPGTFLSLFDYILVEADGSRHYPLKAHRPFEPVISPSTVLTVCLAGASGFGRPAEKVCHCSDLFCRIAGTEPHEPVRPEHVAKVLSTEDLADIYLLNQTDVLADPEEALKLCSYIKKPVLAGSLQKRRFL